LGWIGLSGYPPYQEHQTEHYCGSNIIRNLKKLSCSSYLLQILDFSFCTLSVFFFLTSPSIFDLFFSLRDFDYRRESSGFILIDPAASPRFLAFR
jgi:hypothetical protein